MNRLSVIMDSNEFLKNKNDSDSKKIYSGSLSDLSQSELKHSGTTINREDSILSKGTISSLFFKRTNDGPWSNGSVAGLYTPRPDKTNLLFGRILTVLNDLYEKYSQLTIVDDGIEHQDCNEICTKIDDRIMLIQNFKAYYTTLLENKIVEFDKIQSNFRSLISNKNSKESIDLGDNESYWSICRELFIIESKLEKCTGKLQFQIMDLDSISKVNPMDQYELSIRLNETAKFKTRIKIEKSGHQLWDTRNFDINPVIDDFIYIKFTELKPLNKSVVLIERKLPFINNLIRSAPSIFTLWLTPVGTIKLQVIVQWNAVLDDSSLQSYLNSIDNKFLDHSSKNEVVIRNRGSSTSHKHANNKMSMNIESLFRSSRSDNPFHSNSMSNIIEDVEDNKKPKETYNKLSNEIKSIEIPVPSIYNVIDKEEQNLNGDPEKLTAVKIDDVNETNIQILQNINEKSKAVLLKQESVDITIQEDQLSNKEIEENINAKDENIENILFIKDAPSSRIVNDGEIIESSITMSEATGNVEENEIIMDNRCFVEEDSVLLPINRLINECPTETVTKEIEVEIDVDSSKIESVEQSVDDTIKPSNEIMNSEISCLFETFKHDNYTIEGSEFSNDLKRDDIIEN